jgi:hypothetical protein
MKHNYLSWDCANRSLAYSYISIDTTVVDRLYQTVTDINDLYESYCINTTNCPCDVDEYINILEANYNDPEFLARLNTLIDSAIAICNSHITYISADVIDLLNGKKIKDTTEIQRTIMLYNWLKDSPVSTDKIQVEYVIIEHQPYTNLKSTVVSSQLAFYYANHNPVFVSPKLKNNICLGPNMEFDKYLISRKKEASYVARKKHSKDNFLYFIKVRNLHHVIANIPKPYYDDIADSFMQILAYLRK